MRVRSLQQKKKKEDNSQEGSPCFSGRYSTVQYCMARRRFTVAVRPVRGPIPLSSLDSRGYIWSANKSKANKYTSQNHNKAKQTSTYIARCRRSTVHHVEKRSLRCPRGTCILFVVNFSVKRYIIGLPVAITEVTARENTSTANFAMVFGDPGERISQNILTPTSQR